MPRNLTSADIEKQEFGRSLRGYNEDEVDDFLDRVAQKLWSLEQDNHALKEQVDTLSARLEQYKGLEDTLNSAVLVAQQAAGELTGSARKTVGEIMQSASEAAENLTRSARETAATTLEKAEKNAEEIETRARKAAEEMVGDARRKAELIVQEAETESTSLRDSTLRLLEKTEATQRLMEDRIRVFRSNLRGMLMSHLDLLDQEEQMEPAPDPWGELAHYGEGAGAALTHGGGEASIRGAKEALAQGAGEALTHGGGEASARGAGDNLLTGRDIASAMQEAAAAGEAISRTEADASGDDGTGTEGATTHGADGTSADGAAARDTGVTADGDAAAHGAAAAHGSASPGVIADGDSAGHGAAAHGSGSYVSGGEGAGASGGKKEGEGIEATDSEAADGESEGRYFGR